MAALPWPPSEAGLPRENIMNEAIFDELEKTLGTEGPERALDLLCHRLRERMDYSSLFYALLMKKRYELGVSPLPTSPAQELPPSIHADYEEAIRRAGKEVCQLYLDQGNIPQAWLFARMLGDVQPVADALERYRPAEDEDIQPIVQIAYYEGVHPRKGFDLILSQYGLCHALTTLNGQEPTHPTEARLHCIQKVVRILYQELCERLSADIARREGKAPAVDSGRPATVRALLAGREWLFDNEAYHIDLSHLASVVQLSLELDPGEELRMARELCDYGKRLAPALIGPGAPPFENAYLDYGTFLQVLDGEKVEEGITHFRAKLEKLDLDETGTFPAEVLINLLLRLGRPGEALAVARKYLKQPENRPLTCPNPVELCRLAGDFQALAEMAREKGDPVHFLAGLLAATHGKPHA